MNRKRRRSRAEPSTRPVKQPKIELDSDDQLESPGQEKRVRWEGKSSTVEGSTVDEPSGSVAQEDADSEAVAKVRSAFCVMNSNP